MPPKAIKCCFVPSCTNTSFNVPRKIFFAVPQNMSRRTQWFGAIKGEKFLRVSSDLTKFFCCEDHFNVSGVRYEEIIIFYVYIFKLHFQLENDMKDYLRYKLMPKHHKLFQIKPGIVPHIFKGESSDEKGIIVKEGVVENVYVVQVKKEFPYGLSLLIRIFFIRY